MPPTDREIPVINAKFHHQSSPRLPLSGLIYSDFANVIKQDQLNDEPRTHFPIIT